MASDKAVRRADASAAPTKAKKKWWQGWVHFSTMFDMQFFVLLMIIVIIGLATLYSASHVYAFNYNDGDSYFYIRKQLIWLVAGLAAMFIASLVDYHALHKFAWIVYIGTMIMLILVLVMPNESEIRRWIHIGSVTFQPSEFAKFAVVLLFAHLISLNHNRMNKFWRVNFPMLFLLGLTCAAVLLEPHLSGTLLIGLLGFAMLYMGGTKGWQLLLIMGIGAAVVCVVVFVFGYELDRILVWRHPIEAFANEIEVPGPLSSRDVVWQTMQSMYAIGSGGLLGQGPGNSRQKHLFLPEPQNDFIFSVFCEEMGFVGAVLLLLLFALLMWRGFRIAMKAPDKFGCMLALGLTLQIGLQVGINVAVVSNLFPNTGISLPFFSYGGTSLVVLMAQMGVVLSVSRQSRLEKV